MKFDDEGEAVPDGVTQKVSEEGKLYEVILIYNAVILSNCKWLFFIVIFVQIEEEDVSGININKAKLILKSEDKFDKLRERELLKQK